jgi:signal transduction histidine kinase
MLVALKILAGILLPAHFVGGGLNRYITAKMLTMSIRYGITADSVHALAWFAATLVDRSIGRYQDGYRFGKLSYDLVKRHNYTSVQSKVCLFFGDIVRFYSQPLQGDRAYLHEGFEAGIASGDLLSACYHCNHTVTNMLASGDQLDQVWIESERCLEFVRRAKDPNIEKIILSQQLFILNLQGKAKETLSFGDSQLDEGEFEGQIQNSEMTLMKFWYYILKLTDRYIYDDFHGAAEIVFTARALSSSDPFDTESTQYFFYSALALAAVHDSVNDEKKRQYLEIIRAHRDQLRVWSENCPANFENRHALVCAEIARIQGESVEALRLYDRAISSAENNGFVQNVAVACEVAARYHESIGLKATAESLYARALQGFSRWGASGKVNDLQEKLAKIGKSTLLEPGDRGTRLPSFSSQVDFGAVTKAQRAISSELVPANLHQTFLQIVLETAGAHRGVLILFRDDTLKIEAVFDGEEFHALSTPVKGSSLVPQTVVEYVERLKQRVVLNDCRKRNVFSTDDYFSRQTPLSVLCMPVLRQNKLLAIMYLENNLTTQSFSNECVDLLEMLSSQAAISIENSFMYDEMRSSVKARDEFMAVASHELKSPLSSVSVLLQTLKIALQRGKLNEVPEEKLLRLLDNSTDSIRHLATLIDQLLDVSRFSLGTMKLNVEPLDLSALVQEVVKLNQRDLKNSKSTVEFDLSPDVSGTWDRMRIQQVLNNLVSNAAKYGAGKPIFIQTSVRDGKALLVIKDQGIGIAQQDLKRLFRPFERAVPYRSISGFGLGLYIIKRIVEAHQGQIDVESEPGKGTMFTVNLPLLMPVGGD